MTVDANKATIGGVDYTHRLKTNGTSKEDYRSISFTLEAGATIKVAAMSGSNSSDRTINIWNADTDEVVTSATVYGKDTADGATMYQELIVMTVEEAGTYYIGSANSGVNFYAIYVEYNA